MTARLRLEYDGTEFAGWATQPGLRTVQETVESARFCSNGLGALRVWIR